MTFKAQLLECLPVFHSAQRKTEVPPSSSFSIQNKRILDVEVGGSKVTNKSTLICMRFLLCMVLKMNKSLLMFFTSLWRMLAHRESPNSALLFCHRFKEIGSHIVCSASIQLAHKERETRKGLRKSSLCGVEGKGWVWKKKNCLGASVYSEPNWNYKCIREMSYLWRTVPQAGLFFPSVPVMS